MTNPAITARITRSIALANGDTQITAIVSGDQHADLCSLMARRTVEIRATDKPATLKARVTAAMREAFGR